MTLELAGYVMADVANASGPIVIESMVYCEESDEAAEDVANSVARDLGGVEVLVLPTPPSTESGDPGDAGVLVLLVDDQAGKTLEELSGARADTEVDGPVTTLDGGENDSTTAATGAEAALLTSDDLAIRDGLTGWSTETFPDGKPVGLASLDVNNEFCGAPEPQEVDEVASVWFDRVDDENLSDIAHQVVLFDTPAAASVWIDGLWNQFNQCASGDAFESILTLEDGNDYVPSLVTIGLSPEFQEGECLGRFTNTVYRAFDPADADFSTSDPVLVQIHRIRSCGKNVSILTSRTTVDAVPDTEFVGTVERRAFELIDALPET